MTLKTIYQRPPSTEARDKTRAFLLAAFASLASTPALAALTEAEGTMTWVLNIFSPGLLLALLTIILIGCGIYVWSGKMRGDTWVKILVGCILVFGARTIAPKIVALF